VCGTWLPILREKCKLMAFEKSVLRRMAGGRRRPHNKQLQNLYVSPDIIWELKSRRMRWVGHVECMR
jgi:hypothetical protein